MLTKKIFLLLSCAVSLSLAAQKTVRNQHISADCFTQILNGKNAEIPSKSFTVKALPEMRRTVWKAWKTANATFGEPQLPALDSLSAGVSATWDIPAQLEPDARMPFYFGCKGAKPSEGYPLFLYLHGSGPKSHEWATGLALAKSFADAPSVYFIPQIPNEGQWYRWYQKGKQYVWERLLRQVLLRDDINPDRLYVFGISEGGYGSQRLASFYADYWAAAGPMAGGEPLKNAPAENLSNTAFSLRTGAEDRGFYREKLTRYTNEALDSLEDLNPASFRHHIELIPGRGHHIDYSPTTPWLSHFTRNARPKFFVWEDYEMDGIHRAGFYNLWVNARPDSVLRTRYDVHIDDNTVTIAVENVEYITTEKDPVYGIDLKFARNYSHATSGKFTVFLDEHLVDLSKPVTVIVNGKPAFRGKLRLNVANLIRSIAVFYDPQRLFPAAVEVDLSKL